MEGGVSFFKTGKGWAVLSLIASILFAIVAYFATVDGGGTVNPVTVSLISGIIVFFYVLFQGFSKGCSICSSWFSVFTTNTTTLDSWEDRRYYSRRENVGGSTYSSNTGYQSQTTHYADVPYVDVTRHEKKQDTLQCNECGHISYKNYTTSNTQTYRN
jgi:hypothetical protein